MDFDIVVESLPLLGVCNLCLNEGAVKNMFLGHKHNGITEIYSDMLLKCFSINVSSSCTYVFVFIYRLNKAINLEITGPIIQSSLCSFYYLF